MKKVILITGASSGMGESAARLLLKKGHQVYGAARRMDHMKDLEKAGATILPLDLTRDESIVSCIEEIVKREGRIDVLINNAGYGSYGAVEDVPIEVARRQFEVNLFGLARITQLVLPEMRKNSSGRIVNISSMGGKMYTPLGAWYHATKHALEGWSDCLRLELKESGIDVVIVEPGVIKTPWVDVSVQNLLETSGNGAYSRMANKVAQNLTELYSSNSATDADVLGRVIARAATVDNPKTRYVKGHLARMAMTARKWLGDRIYDRLMIYQMGGDSPIF